MRIDPSRQVSTLKDLINIGVGGPLSCRNLRISRVFEPCVFWGLLRIRWSSKNAKEVTGKLRLLFRCLWCLARLGQEVPEARFSWRGKTALSVGGKTALSVGGKMALSFAGDMGGRMQKNP